MFCMCCRHDSGIWDKSKAAWTWAIRVGLLSTGFVLCSSWIIWSFPFALLTAVFPGNCLFVHAVIGSEMFIEWSERRCKVGACLNAFNCAFTNCLQRTSHERSVLLGNHWFLLLPSFFLACRRLSDQLRTDLETLRTERGQGKFQMSNVHKGTISALRRVRC